MRDIDELFQKAKDDLAKAHQREGKAREALETAIADKSRLEGFLTVLGQYVHLPAGKSGETQIKGGRQSRLGTSAIALLRAHGSPMPIGPLADAVEGDGHEIGGGDRRNAYLASYLSKDPRLISIRGSGWWAPELGDPPGHAGLNADRPENTEPPDDTLSEGSSVAGSGEPVSLLDLQHYRMGGGGTRNN